MFKLGLLIAAAAIVAPLSEAQAKPQPGPPATQDFVNEAAQSDAYEITAGRLTATQSENPQVRSFAQQMVTAHTQTREALQQAATAARLPPPPMTLGGDQQRMLNALQSLKGAELDRAYVTQQVNAHAAALVTTQGYAAAGPDPAVRRAAQSNVPLIEHHLEMARALKASVGGG
jgi:putative membrane protein